MNTYRINNELGGGGGLIKRYVKKKNRKYKSIKENLINVKCKVI